MFIIYCFYLCKNKKLGTIKMSLIFILLEYHVMNINTIKLHQINSVQRYDDKYMYIKTAVLIV